MPQKKETGRGIKPKSKMKRLKWIVDTLEENLTIDYLVTNPVITMEIAEGLKENFLSQEAATRLDEIISNVDQESFLRFKKNPSNIDLGHAVIGGLVKNIYAIYYDLKSIWTEFKKSLSIYRNRQLLITNFSLAIPHKINLDADKVNVTSKNAIIFLEETNCDIAVSSDTALTFLSLLNGLSFDRIQQCKSCQKWFISTYRGKEKAKESCGNRCASRENKRDLRSNDARKDDWEDVKKKQRDSRRI